MRQLVAFPDVEIRGFSKLLLLNALWRFGRSQAAGRALVDALGSEDEDLQTVAGTLLAKAGRRAGPLLLEAIESRRDLPQTLLLLASIGDPAHTSLIRAYVDDEDPEAARAAGHALRVLEYDAQERTTCGGDPYSR